MEVGILGALSSALGLGRFVAYFVPGFVAVTFYDLRIPGQRKFNELVIPLVVFSVALDTAILLALSRLSFNGTSLIDWALLVGFGAVLVPAIVGWLMVDVRRVLARRFGLVDPGQKAWDEFFAQIYRSKRAALLVCTLNDAAKTKVGGFYASDGYSSTYPAEEDLLIDKPCVLDRETGALVAEIEGSKGLLVKRDDILFIEWFDAQEAIAAAAAKEDPNAEES